MHIVVVKCIAVTNVAKFTVTLRNLMFFFQYRP